MPSTCAQSTGNTRAAGYVVSVDAVVFTKPWRLTSAANASIKLHNGLQFSGIVTIPVHKIITII